MLLFVASVAFANEVAAGLVLPGAARADAGSVNAGVSAGTLVDVGVNFVSIDAGFAPTDRLGLRASVLTAGEGDPTSGLLGGTLGVRYLVVDGPRFRLAPFAAGAVGTAGEGVTGTLVGWTAGVAFEAGGEHVWFDAAVPLVAGLAVPPGNGDESHAVVSIPYTILGSEVGVTVAVAEDHRVRAGLASIMPTLSYRYAGSPVYAGATVGGLVLPELTVAAAVEVGARW